MAIHDTGAGDLPVFYLHGTPNTGEPPAPFTAASARRGVRWLGYDRPGYGDRPRRPGRDVASAAAEVARIADDRGLDRFGVLGHSGGGAHALACAALLPDRVAAVVSIAAPAPYDAGGLDWFAGMTSPDALRAAVAGRAAKEAYEASAAAGAALVPFTPDDWAALEGDWSWFGGVVEAALAGGRDGLVDDDLALVRPWGGDPAAIRVPALIVHGTADEMVPVAHGRWLAGRVPGAEWRPVAGAGHISVLHDHPYALDWIAARMRA